ncbi:hypothetical protein BIY27_06160 [Gibbsiella quercinecans]|nr:hypothetical protein BIY27_06160 [Gibbsiella quercinecans]
MRQFIVGHASADALGKRDQVYMSDETLFLQYCVHHIVVHGIDLADDCVLQQDLTASSQNFLAVHQATEQQITIFTHPLLQQPLVANNIGRVTQRPKSRRFGIEFFPSAIQVLFHVAVLL